MISRPKKLYSIEPSGTIAPELLEQLAGPGQLITHAHNPALPALLTRCYGWKGGAFVVLERGDPVGYISCMSILGKLVSMPYFSYGGLLTKEEEVETMYDEVLPQLATLLQTRKGRKLSYLVRSQHPFGPYSYSTKVVSFLSLSDPQSGNLIPARQAKKARKSEEAGCSFKFGGNELLPDFYRTYARNMFRLGSPVLSLRFFLYLLEEYEQGHCLLFVVYRQSKPIGASFLISYNGFFENTWFATLSDQNRYFPSSLLHREMIRYAAAHQGHTYSFGRSTVNSGVHTYKQRWGTSEIQTFWNTDTEVFAGLRKWNFLPRLWKVLPLSMANQLGPQISRYIY